MKRLIIFALVAALLLPIGYLGAQIVWSFLHHRYDTPETGLYHGFVSVMFDNVAEPMYWLHFQGRSCPRWYWKQPSNFSYSTLDVDWYDQTARRHATVSLPAFTYRSDSASGAFTRDVLAEWLFGTATNRVSDRQHVDAVFSYFEAAAAGSLPGPRHHTYNFEKPIRVNIQHFLLGYGVGSTAYVWFGVWLLMVLVVGQKVLGSGHGR
jgi:hypothetical protein